MSAQSNHFGGSPQILPQNSTAASVLPLVPASSSNRGPSIFPTRTVALEPAHEVKKENNKKKELRIFDSSSLNLLP